MNSTAPRSVPSWPPPGVADRLLPLLQKSFGYHAHIFPTGNLTGRSLWTLTRPNWREDFPPLPEPLQSFYRETSGQGRTEVTTLPELETIPGGFVYDMRFAYGASCEGLPAGPPEREAWPTLRPWSDDDRYRRGRYHIRFRIPDDWNHIGLFMVKRPKRDTGWIYPADPGGEYETWATNAEVALALRHGWRVEVDERITFPHTNTVPRPLDVWVKRLRKLWYEQADDVPVQDAVRDIVIQTIGGFHAHRRRMDDWVPDSEPRPADARDIHWNRAKGRIEFTHWAPLPAKDLPYSHVEWSIDIWARIRCKLLDFKERGALSVPRQHVLGMRTDALYLAVDPRWEDDGAIGSFRLRAGRTGPLDAPHDAKSLRLIGGD
jgi:hypothetical protein